MCRSGLTVVCRNWSMYAWPDEMKCQFATYPSADSPSTAKRWPSTRSSSSNE